jgi:hypothetical protein
VGDEEEQPPPESRPPGGALHGPTPSGSLDGAATSSEADQPTWAVASSTSAGEDGDEGEFLGWLPVAGMGARRVGFADVLRRTMDWQRTNDP